MGYCCTVWKDVCGFKQNNNITGLKRMMGMSQQNNQSTGIKVSQSPGGKSSFAFSYEQVPPRPTKSIVSAGKTTFTLAWDQQITKTTKPLLPLSPTVKSNFSLAWDSKDPSKKIRHYKQNHLSPDVRNYYDNGSPKNSTVRVNCPPGGHSSIKIG